MYGWVPKDSGITIEDSEDLVYIKHNNEVKATYTRPSEAILKQDVEAVLAEVAKQKNLEGVLK